MSLASKAQEQLTRDEGNVAYAYQDNLGYWTIGIGILIDKRKGGGLRPEEIQFIFLNRFTLKSAELYAKLPWVKLLDEPRQGALINMSFQMGVDGLLKFHRSLAAIKVKNWEEAAKELKLSDWYEQTPSRAVRVIEQIRTGNWQT